MVKAKLPHTEILVGYIPGGQDYSNEKTLSLPDAQNNILNTFSWIILRRNPTLEVTILIDKVKSNGLHDPLKV